MLVLSEVFDEFLDLKEINPKPSEQSVWRLIEVAGDLPVDQYTRIHGSNTSVKWLNRLIKV